MSEKGNSSQKVSRRLQKAENEQSPKVIVEQMSSLLRLQLNSINQELVLEKINTIMVELSG